MTYIGLLSKRWSGDPVGYLYHEYFPEIFLPKVCTRMFFQDKILIENRSTSIKNEESFYHKNNKSGHQK